MTKRFKHFENKKQYLPFWIIAMLIAKINYRKSMNILTDQVLKDKLLTF